MPPRRSAAAAAAAMDVKGVKSEPKPPVGAVATSATARPPASSAAASKPPATPQFWLIKLPTFVIEELTKPENKRGTGNASVATIEVDHSKLSADGKPFMKLILNSGKTLSSIGSTAPPPPTAGAGAVAGAGSAASAVPVSTSVISTSDGGQIPAEYRMEMRAQQHAMVVFSETPARTATAPDGSTTVVVAGSTKLEGSLTAAVDIVPFDTPEYRALLRTRLLKSFTKNRVTQRVDHATALENANAPEKRKAEEEAHKANHRKDKRVKVADDQVRDMLFAEFDRARYIPFAELQKATNQPTEGLKSVLSSIAVYNSAGPFKQTWSLKAEFLTSKDAALTAAAIKQKQDIADSWNKPQTAAATTNSPFLPAPALTISAASAPAPPAAPKR